MGVETVRDIFSNKVVRLFLTLSVNGRLQELHTSMTLIALT